MLIRALDGIIVEMYLIFNPMAISRETRINRITKFLNKIRCKRRFKKYETSAFTAACGAVVGTNNEKVELSFGGRISYFLSATAVKDSKVGKLRRIC